MTKEAANRPSRRTAILVGLVFSAIGAWNFHRGRHLGAAVPGGAGLLLLLAALVSPGFARAFHRFWMQLAAVLGHVNSRILLSLLFYALFTPYGWLLRTLGRDPLDRRQKKRASYWVPCKRPRQSKEQFERLF